MEHKADPASSAVHEPATMTVDEAVRIWGEMLTTGEERFREAEALERAGNAAQAAAIYEKLWAELPATWVDRAAQQRLASLRAAEKSKRGPQ